MNSKDQNADSMDVCEEQPGPDEGAHGVKDNESPLLDALPYFDVEYEMLKPQVEALIEEEMKKFPMTKDYLGYLPLPDTSFIKSKVLKNEFARMLKGEKMKSFDRNNYVLQPPPANRKSNPQEWQKSIDKANILHEYQSLRAINLDLLQQHGANAWKVYNSQLEGVKERLKRKLDDIKEETENLHQRRKVEQLEAGQDIRQLEAEWMQNTLKNIEIAQSCTLLEQEIEDITNAVQQEMENQT